jgi:4-hydroxybenzoate polyprenyltransferase
MNTDRQKVFAYLQLMRVSNVFTAMADVLAGYFIVGGTAGPGALLCLLASSAAIYAAGCVLNDLCDFDLDSRERPGRPLPSGEVSRNEAWVLVFLLFGTGLSAAFLAGRAAFTLAVLLAALVVLYDGRTKSLELTGPANMAACRGINFILGMSANLPGAGLLWFFPLLSFLYVFALTVLSRFEVEEKGFAKKGRLVFGGWTCVMLVLACVSSAAAPSGAGIAFLCALVLWTGPPLFSALWKPSPKIIGRAVKTLILGIPLLDAVYAAGIRGWVFGFAVTLCLVPAVLLSRRLYVT